MTERIRSLLPILGLTVAAALVVVLSLKVRDLNERYARLYQRATGPHAGMWVPTFRAATSTGDSVTIGETKDGTRQVLFFFTVTCPYCKSTLPAWDEMTRKLAAYKDPRVEVYGVSLSSPDSTRKYMEQNEVAFPVLHFPEEKLSRIYRAGAVPATVVLDEQGRMIHARVGEISKTERPAIDSVLTMARWKPEPRPAQQPGEEVGGS